MLILNSYAEVHRKLYQHQPVMASVKKGMHRLARILFPRATVQRPFWFHFSDRSWNRNSAFIMLQHKHLDDRISNG